MNDPTAPGTSAADAAPTDARRGSTSAPSTGRVPSLPHQPVDVLPILAAMQDQLDDLTAIVRAQQASIDALTAALNTRRR